MSAETGLTADGIESVRVWHQQTAPYAEQLQDWVRIASTRIGDLLATVAEQNGSLDALRARLATAETALREIRAQQKEDFDRAASAEARLVTHTRAADRLADEVAVLVRRGTLDARSPAGDALLDYREPPSTERADRLAALEEKLATLQRAKDDALVHELHRAIPARVRELEEKLAAVERERDEARKDAAEDYAMHRAESSRLRKFIVERRHRAGAAREIPGDDARRRIYDHELEILALFEAALAPAGRPQIGHEFVPRAIYKDGRGTLVELEDQCGYVTDPMTNAPAFDVVRCNRPRSAHPTGRQETE